MVLINVEKYFRVHCRACCGERIKEEAKQLGAYIERYDYFENKHTGVTGFIFDAHCSEKFMFPYGGDSSNGRVPLHCGGYGFEAHSLFLIFIFGG